MALYEKGTGLLGTHVTWDDVENEIQRSFGPGAKFGPNKTIIDISAGNGFFSQIGIVEPDWQCTDVLELPEKFAVKIITMALAEGLFSMKGDGLVEHENAFKKVHNREVQVYGKLKELKNPHVLSLKIFGAVPFTEENPSKGFLLMEAVEDIANIHSDRIVDDQLIEQILEATAAFHSMTWDFTAEEESLVYNLYSGVWSVMFEKEFIANSMAHHRTLLGEGANAELLEKLQAAGLEMENLKYRRLIDTTAERTGMRRMLCHGDVWSCNMLFTASKEGTLKLKSLIDFQLVHFGCVGQDLVRMMCTMLTKEQRDNREIYLNSYYNHLARFLGDRPVPFTMEQLAASVDVYMGPSSFIVASCMSGLSSGIISRRKDKEKEAARLVIADKVTGLISDVFKYHNLNMEAFASLE